MEGNFNGSQYNQRPVILKTPLVHIVNKTGYIQDKLIVCILEYGQLVKCIRYLNWTHWFGGFE